MKIIWVATDGNDSTGNGSYALPYKTIEKALQEFTDSDQIRIKSGTYTPTDSVVISGVSGSLFAEDRNGVFIQPEKTRNHQACLAILDAERFSIYGINILQAADSSGNLIGIYAENVETFLCYTCEVSDFAVPSGTGHGIYASGVNGRVEGCKVSNFSCAGDMLYGIRTNGINIIDCAVDTLSGAGNCEVIAIDIIGN